MAQRNKQNRDGSLQSPWQSRPPAIPAAQISDEVFDVLVIGGGITGLTTALMLQQQGKKCVLAEANTIGFGTTGGTSAHINTFADTTYREADRNFGAAGAQLFADAINDGFAIIRNNIAEWNIDCDFEMKDGYVYAEDEKQAGELKGLYEGAVAVSVPVNFSHRVPTPVPHIQGLIFPGQAQFHPIRYLHGIQQAFLDAGGIILQHTKVDGLEHKDGISYASVGSQSIKARHVVYATHTVPGINLFSFRCAPYRSYVLAVTLTDKNYPDALLYDMQEPYHYFRTHKIAGRRNLLVGGNDHKTGHDSPENAFAELEKYVRRYYNVGEVVYKWSSQYYVPVDGLPYIGHMPGSASHYCATGYNGNGMMLGSVAARIIADSILGKYNRYAELFSPSRIKPVAGFTGFIKENADVVYQFVASRFTAEHIASLSSIKKGTGEVVDFDGHKLAVYRHEDGTIHALDPVCTHAGCIVGWNSEEKSWDCPCHGARFSIDGKVLNVPADRNLQKIDF